MFFDGTETCRTITFRSRDLEALDSVSGKRKSASSELLNSKRQRT
jgi:hypothetical protein